MKQEQKIEFIVTPDGELKGFKDPNFIIDDLVIPSKYEGIIISKIGSNAFSGKQFSSLSIPETVTSIGDNAFGGSEVLLDQKISMPTKLKQ